MGPVGRLHTIQSGLIHTRGILINKPQSYSRKKARCPGEKPVCSLCQRLGQHCTYAAQVISNRARVQRDTTSGGPEVDADDCQEVPSLEI